MGLATNTPLLDKGFKSGAGPVLVSQGMLVDVMRYGIVGSQGVKKQVGLYYEKPTGIPEV